MRKRHARARNKHEEDDVTSEWWIEGEGIFSRAGDVDAGLERDGVLWHLGTVLASLFTSTADKVHAYAAFAMSA